jgi:hypothetical protein
MCTVTVVPHAAGVRLLCNRDERRSRREALRPRVHDLGGMRAVFPVDPEGGGTWVGCNSGGLAVALLNAHPAGRPDTLPPSRSRGLIVRALLGRTSLSEALSEVDGVDPEAFGAFRLVILYGRRVAIVSSDAVSLTRRASDIVEAPLLFTSSSLGDSLVALPRRRLFQRLVLRAGDTGWLAGQARFHDHQWPARPALSVRMERPDALTVSRTTVDLTNDGCALRYHAPLRARDTGEEQCCLPH